MIGLGQRWRRLNRERRQRVESAVMFETGGIVCAGPFAGLRYPVARSAGSSLAPKLLGSYELEIQDFVERAIANRPAQVVNIGAGEGYYAVGLALRLPDASVFAFEKSESARALIRALAEHNGVASRVHVHGECLVSDLCRLRAAASIDQLISTSRVMSEFMPEFARPHHSRARARNRTHAGRGKASPSLVGDSNPVSGSRASTTIEPER